MIKKIDANKYGVVRYAISSIEDIADLPREVSVGSEAILVNEDGEKKFRLGSDGWVEVVEVKEYDEDKLRDILEDAKVGYGGIEYETLEERLDKDFDDVYSVLDNRTYVEYEGCRITAKDSLNGLQKETVVKGRTFQNLLSAMKPKRGLSFNNGIYETDPTIDPHTGFWTLGMIKGNTIYSLIIEFLEIPNGINDINVFGETEFGQNYRIESPKTNKRYVLSRLSKEVVTDLYFGFSPLKITEPIKFRAVLLEGDYKQNPPEELPFIEGIESVGDKSKNLFDGETRNGYYSAGEFKVNSSNLANVNPIEIKPNTYYTGSGDVPPRMTIYDSDMNFVSYHSGTFLSPSNAKYMNIHANGATYFQVEEGIQATAYEPYYDGYKVSGKNIGKNLLDYNKLTYGYYFNPSTGEYTTHVASCATGYIKFNKCNISISGLFNQTSSYVGYYDADYNFIGRSSANPVTEHKLTVGSVSVIADSSYKGYVIPANTEYITLSIYRNSTVNPNTTNETIKENIKYLQIEENSTPTPYEPYKESTYSYILNEPLRSLPNEVCDEIDLEKGVVTRRVGLYTFTGDEPFGLASEVKGDVICVYIGVAGINVDKVKTLNNAICDNLACYPYGSYEDIQGILVSDSCFILSFKKGTLKTYDIEGAKQWLKDNPTTVYYELANPIAEYLIKDDKFVTLPNGVKDEAGRIVTRNVGKIVLNGSSGEKWEVWNIAGENVYRFVVPIPNLKATSGNPLLCNIFKYLSLANADEEGIYNGNQGRIGLKISKTKLTSETIDELRKWLALNPLTVYYQLETPYIECSYEEHPTLPNGVKDEVSYNSVLRRVGKFVVDGSQVLTRSATNSNKTKTTHFSVNGVSSNSPYGICDKLPTVIDVALQVYEEPCMKFSSADKINPPYALWLNIDRSNADTVEEAYEYFRNNPHTVWYELIKPYVEPINLDEVILDTTRLKSYEPITHITSDNYLPPTIKTQVPSDFNAVVLGLKSNNEALASQVMSLRQTNDELEATNREQDDVIDVTLLALDEVYGMIDEGEIETMSVGSPMVNVYVKMIKRGIKTLDEVPAKYRAEVEELI